ncbi:MAG TPA: hypothetical protein VES67_15690 [Vicinamibacterales bacterium]|nr:hypothetical protein [Vicinamibacterales bacterium]
MLSRYLVILLALVAAIIRAEQGEWLAAAGLAFLALGLAMLKLAVAKPTLKPFAYVSFAVTAVTMVIVLARMRS